MAILSFNKFNIATVMCPVNGKPAVFKGQQNKEKNISLFGQNSYPRIVRTTVYFSLLKKYFPLCS